MKLVCRHVAADSKMDYICIPLSAQGETLGVLHLGFGGESAKMDASKRRLLTGLAEQAAMALANLKLRDKLKSQSIRDPLTGLFNRRYMEESLEREFCRADRNGKKVGLVMIDLDRFKQFNDTFGHDAGDRVLQEVCSVISNSFRREDIVCRYGGEELLVIVPEVSKEELIERAEGTRERIKAVHVQHKNQLLGSVTASFGVAAYPDDATTQAELVSKADIALYQAKRAGRDRVVACGRDSALVSHDDAAVANTVM